MASIPLSSDPIVQPLLDRLDQIVRRYPMGIATEDDLLVFYCAIHEFMGDVAVAALDALVDRYGLGASSGLLRISPDELVRKGLRERFGVKP